MTTTLTGKNQITVPAEITQRLGLTPGTQFDWAYASEPDKLVVTIQPSPKQIIERIHQIAAKYQKPPGHDPVAELVREREDEDRLREDDLR